MIKKLWRRIRNLGNHKAVILMYHQVCCKRTDPWQLAVEPGRFQLQLQLLKDNFAVVPVDELVSCIARKRLSQNMVAITFDDGFADNYSHAAPLLEWYRLPATFYLATDPLRQRRYYWWDELEAIILHAPGLPGQLSLQVGGKQISFRFLKGSVLNSRKSGEIRSWHYGMPVVSERVALYLLLWESLKPLPPREQREALENLRAWAGLEAFDCRHGAIMEDYQIRKLSGNPLFTIGAHTVHHAMLAAHEEPEQEFQIAESKKEIEGLLGKPVTGFSYPYGNYNNHTKDLLRENGFEYAVSTESRAATADADLFELPRVQVRNWTPEQFSFNIHQTLCS